VAGPEYGPSPRRARPAGSTPTIGQRRRSISKETPIACDEPPNRVNSNPARLENGKHQGLDGGRTQHRGGYLASRFGRRELLKVPRGRRECGLRRRGLHHFPDGFGVVRQELGDVGLDAMFRGVVDLVLGVGVGDPGVAAVGRLAPQ